MALARPGFLQVRREQGGPGTVRSWTLAASTTTTMSRPKVSVTMNRCLPLIFLPAS